MMQRFARDVVIYGGADLLFKLVQFAFIPIYSHRLSVAQFGILALLQVSATLIGVLVNLGVNHSIHRFYFDKDVAEARRPLLITTGLVQLLASMLLALPLLGFALYGAREAIADDYGIGWILVVVALVTILPDQIAQYTLDTSRLQFAAYRFCAIALVKNVAGLLIGLWLLLVHDMGLLGLLVGNLVAALAAVPLGLWLVRRDITLGVDLAYVRRLLGFGWPFVFAAAGYWAFSSIDRWLLAELRGAVEVGLFSVAFKFASVIFFVVAAFHQAWIPTAMRMANENPDYRRIIAMVFSGWFFAIALMALGIALFAEEILMLLTPQSYWPAAPALAVGAAGLALLGTTQVTMLGISFEKRTNLIATGAWLTAAVNVGLNLLWIPAFGATGSAAATLGSFAFLTSFYLYWTQRLHPLPLERFKLLYSLALVALATLAPFVPDGPPFALVAIAGKAGLMMLAIIGAVAAGILNMGLMRHLNPRLQGTVT